MGSLPSAPSVAAAAPRHRSSVYSEQIASTQSLSFRIQSKAKQASTRSMKKRQLRWSCNARGVGPRFATPSRQTRWACASVSQRTGTGRVGRLSWLAVSPRTCGSQPLADAARLVGRADCGLVDAYVGLGARARARARVVDRQVAPFGRSLRPKERDRIGRPVRRCRPVRWRVAFPVCLSSPRSLERAAVVNKHAPYHTDRLLACLSARRGHELPPPPPPPLPPLSLPAPNTTADSAPRKAARERDKQASAHFGAGYLPSWCLAGWLGQVGQHFARIDLRCKPRACAQAQQGGPE